MIPYSTQLIDEIDVKSVIKALHSSALTQGELNEQFEQEIAQFLGVKYALTFNSATSALYAAYKANFAPNDCVITTPISFVATANMLLESECVPYFVDVLDSGNINPDKIKQAILDIKSKNLQNLKGIVSMDFGGNSVDVESISALAREHNLTFISDSSHSFGGSVNDIKIGNFADVSIFSFHAIKPITTCEGGALVTNNKDIYDKAKLVRSHGLTKKDLWESEVQISGFNFRMNEIQAALGLSQLQKINIFLNRREEIAQYYDEIFSGNEFFTTPHSKKPASHFSTNHLYPILLSENLWTQKRYIFENLHAIGLGVQVHYKPISDYELYQNCAHSDLSNARRFYKSEISIPCHHAMNQEEVIYCAKNILDVFKNLKQKG